MATVKVLSISLFSVIMTVLLYFLPMGTGLAGHNKPSIFTVQTGTYEFLEKAQENFSKFITAFPHDAEKLRIESHPPYFVLRAGSFSEPGPARKLRNKLARLFSDAIVLDAYYIEDRILSDQTEPQSSGQKNTSYIPSSIVADEYTSSASVVPRNEQISDSQATVMLTELLLRQGGTDNLKRSGLLVEKLKQSGTDTVLAGLLEIRIEAALGKRHRAAELIEEFIRDKGFNPEEWVELADISASMGHFARCRDIYLTVLERIEGPEKQRLRLIYAERALLWGDFYTSELIIREAMGFDPGNLELKLSLAANLIAQQRFIQADKYLDQALSEASEESDVSKKAWIMKVDLGLLEKDYDRAARAADGFISVYSTPEQILIPGARAYYEAGRIEDAQNLYQQALPKDSLEAQALSGLGLVKIFQKDREAAARHFKAVASDSDQYPLARVLLLRNNSTALSGLVDDFIQDEDDPARLIDLAQALSGQGFFEMAIRVYGAVLLIDDRYFPARMGLAEVLAASKQYARSLEILKSLRSVFPDSYKIDLTRARVLAWARDYEDSIAAYEEIYLENPANSVVLIESGRTAYWGKMADQGDDLYQIIYLPSVDQRLLQRLLDLNSPLTGQIPASRLKALSVQIDQGTVFEGYEGFFAWFEDNAKDLNARLAADIRAIERDLYHEYVTHKRAFLERKSKSLAWNRRFAPARRSLRELTEFDPGNQEALFDLAQAECALGLCDEERQVYETLLDLDPLHGQALKALARQKIRSCPLVFGGYNFWREKGRGALARMTRNRFDLGVEVPVLYRHNFKLITHKYFESPQKYADTVQASGISLQGEIKAGPYITFAGRITHKTYNQDLRIKNFSGLTGRPVAEDSFKTGLADITPGNLSMRLNLDNYAALTAGYEKREEVANAMALAQGIYSHRFRTRLEMYPARKMDLALEAEHIDYNDNNSGSTYSGEIGYAFTDHPRTFKAILSAQYRDTSREYQACAGTSAGCSITDDFKHPYWTPQDYSGAAITFEFRHDLAKDFFCGAREHFYDLKLTLGTEQDSNNSIEIRGLWQRELADRLGLRARTMWHNSREWKAMAGEFGMFFRF